MSSNGAPIAEGPLAGLKVIDAAVLFAGPVIGTLLARLRRGRHQGRASHGATPCAPWVGRRTASRCGGRSSTATSAWCPSTWASPRARTCSRSWCADADVLIESFRPGTFERWGLGPDVLHAINPGLVMVRCSGYGQTGPYSPRPGFGTVAESISGFAHINGQPDGPPTLPPFALGDGVASMFGTFATMFALWHRELHTAPGPGGGPRHLRATVLAAGPAVARVRPAGQGPEPDRQQHRLDRPSQRLPDRGRQVAGPVGQLPVDRGAGHAPGGPPGGGRASPGSADHTGRVEHQDILNEYIGDWIAGHDHAGGPGRVRGAAGGRGPDLLHRGHLQGPQYIARDTITTVDDPRLGPPGCRTPSRA